MIGERLGHQDDALRSGARNSYVRAFELKQEFLFALDDICIAYAKRDNDCISFATLKALYRIDGLKNCLRIGFREKLNQFSDDKGFLRLVWCGVTMPIPDLKNSSSV
jgi:hypothetical protein